LHSKALNIIATGWDFKLPTSYNFRAEGIIAASNNPQRQGWIKGAAIGAIARLKSTKVTSFTIIFNNSENSIRDERLFCHPLYCHSSVVEYTSSHLSCINEPAFRLDYQILLKSPQLSLAGWIRPCTEA